MLILVVIGSICYITCLYPRFMDDWLFLDNIQEMGVWGTLKNRFIIDNSRIGNMLNIVLLKAPIFVARIIQCLGFSLGFLFMCLIMHPYIRSLRGLSLFVFLFLFTPSWDEQMFSQPFMFNYILPIPLLFGMIYCFFNSDKVPIWVGVLFGVLLGVWHESYGLTFISGCLTLWLIKRTKYSRIQKIYIIAVAIGCLWLILNPGNWYRADIYYKFKFTSFKTLIFNWPYFLFIVIWIIAVLSPKFHNIARNRIVAFSVGGFIFIPFVLISSAPRAAMPAILLCCCSLTILIRAMCKNIRTYFKNIIAALLYIISCLHLGAVCHETTLQVDTYKSFVKAMLNAAPDEEYVFAPIRYSYQAPCITLFKSGWDLMDPSKFNIAYIQIFTDRDWDFLVIPEHLRNYRAGMGNPASSDSAIRIWEGEIVSSNLNDTIFSAAKTIYKYSRKPEFSHIKKRMFRSSDGREYLYIYPRRSYFSRFMGEPVSINLE